MPQPPAPPPAPTPPAPPAPPDPSPQPPQPTTQTVPYDRFASVNAEKNAAEERARAAEARAQALEDANATELERAQRERDREKARADAAESRYQTTVRDNAIRGVAAKAEGDRPPAIDADAVVALLGTGQYGEVKADDPASVAAAVTKLHEAKPTLFAAASPTPPAPTSFGLPAGAPPAPTSDPTQPNPQDSERGSMGRAMLTMLKGPGSGAAQQ